MGDPYTDVSVTGYNTSPPSDDGSQTASNRVDWSTVTDKVGDPLKNAIDSINANVGAGFDKVLGGAGVSPTAISYTVQTADQGELIVATASGITITTPSGATVGSPFWFGLLNNSSGDITLAGDVLIDGQANLTVPAGGGLIAATNGTDWFTTGSNFERTRVMPQGRLTLVSNTPVISSDQAAKTAVYYTPYTGNLVPVPNSDGTDFQTKEFSQLQLDLNDPGHVADTLYDVYIYDDSGTTSIATGPAWTTSTAGSGDRGTGAGTAEITRLKGLYVNANSMTVRNGATTDTVDANEGIYVGTILIDGTAGQVTCHVSAGQSRVWGVWNAFNRTIASIKVYDATASWTYNTDSVWRVANNDSTNIASLACGLQEEWVDCQYHCVAESNGVGGGKPRVSIGVNGSTSPQGVAGRGTSVANQEIMLIAKHHLTPFIGLSTLSPIEIHEGASATSTFTSGAENMSMFLTYMA